MLNQKLESQIKYQLELHNLKKNMNPKFKECLLQNKTMLN